MMQTLSLLEGFRGKCMHICLHPPVNRLAWGFQSDPPEKVRDRSDRNICVKGASVLIFKTLLPLCSPGDPVSNTLSILGYGKCSLTVLYIWGSGVVVLGSEVCLDYRTCGPLLFSVSQCLVHTGRLHAFPMQVLPAQVLHSSSCLHPIFVYWDM